MLGNSNACKLVSVKGVSYCCCPKPRPLLPSWLKNFLLSVCLSVPIILAAKWVVAKGHLDYVIKRMHFLAKERLTLECDIQSLIERCCPSQTVLSGSAARRKAALDQLRSWTWQSDNTYEKVVCLRKQKQELEFQLKQVLRERDCARRDFAIVQSVLKRNFCRKRCENPVCL